MAPWPEPENQPKAPDKNDKREQTEVNTRSESEEAADNTICASSDQKVEDKDVSGLNDGQLRALLDEAFSYKCPKDREGKSELFKELLQEAEADETDSKVLGGSLGGKLPRAHYNLQRRRQSRHSGASRECGVGVSTTRGGSLQNLHALGMEGGRRSRRRDTLVSARQREGGSLPTNVNVDDHDLDIICPNYTSRATLEVKEPKKPESMERLETTAQGIPNGSEIITKEEEARVDNAFASSISSIQEMGLNKKVRAAQAKVPDQETKGVGPVESGAMLYPSTPVQHVSVLSIPPGQLSVGTDDNRFSENLEVKKLNISRSRQQKKGHLMEETDNTSEGLLGLPLTAYWNRYSSFTLLDFQDEPERKKKNRLNRSTSSGQHNDHPYAIPFLKIPSSYTGIEVQEAICYCELCEALEALEIEISEESSTSVPVADHSKKPVNRKKRRSRKKKSKRKNAEKVDDTVLILIIQDPSPIKVQREKWRLTLPPIPELAEPSSTECSLDTTASFLPDTDMRDDEDKPEPYVPEEGPYPSPSYTKYKKQITCQGNQAKKEIVGLQDARQLNLDAVQKPSPDSLQVLKDALHSAVRDGFGIPFLEEVDPGPLPPPTRLSSERRSLLLNKSTSASEFKPYHKNQPPTKTLRSTARDGFGIPFLEEVDPGPLPPPTPLSSERRSLLLNKSTSASEFKPYHKNKPPPKTLRSTARDGFGIPFLEEVDPGPLPPPTPLSSERRSLLLNKSTSASEFKPYHKNKPPPKNSNTRLAFSNSADSKAKPVDENGNALSCVRVDSNCLDRKKQRRVKTKNDRNTISLKIDEIEGFRGEADIDTLMEYIESPSLDSNKNKARSNQPNNPRTSVKVRAKEEEPRSTKKRREKFKRSNSLEEVSKTKLEDLTEHTSSEKIKSSLPIQKKPLTVEDTDVWQRSSWNKDEDHLLQEPKKMSSERISPELLQESEFLIVTKKQRKKKRRVVCSSRSTSKTTYYSRESGSGRLLYQYQNDQGTSQPRRKSASSVPPSDKSDSSDLDSVHSLPVSSSTRQRVMKNSVSGGSTPQASYADIARSAAGLPSDSCVINVVTYTDSDIRTSVIPILSLPSPAASKKDATTETCDTFLTTEDYPPLDNRNVDFCTDISKFPLSGTKDKSRKQPVIVRDNERPAVILMNDRAEAQISEIKFGFDINYQLLESEAKCNKSRNTAYTLVDQTAPAPTQNVAEFFCRFPSDDNVVHYLTSSWEEVLDKLQSGKASYYDGQ